jgi:dTDP-glucose 4,6-dehydratase
MTTSYEKVILVTGGCGFVGSHMVIHLVKNYPQYFVLNLDKLDYCASTHLLTSIENCSNYEFVKGDILDSSLVSYLLKRFNVTYIYHFAAQTHVDNSFGNSLQFTSVNVLGVHTLLECSKSYGKLQRFIHVSTDEVYGQSAYSGQGAVEGQTVLQPTNPYAATKAGAEHIVMSYYKSWKFPVIITRSNNIYGPHQYPEKVIPKWICRLNRNQKCPIHGDGSNERAFMYVDDVIAAYDIIMHQGVIGEIYNFQSSLEISNLELSTRVIKACGKSGDPSEWREFVSDRAFNDQRYHVDGSKLFELGWKEKVSFDEGMKRTVEWYTKNDISKIWGDKTAIIALEAHPQFHLMGINPF